MGGLFVPDRFIELELVSRCIGIKFSALCNYIQGFLCGDSKMAKQIKYRVERLHL